MRNIVYALLLLINSAVLSACDGDRSADVTDGLPYAVGSNTFFIHDFERPYDSVAGVDAGLRILITEVWYPVDHAVVDEGRDRYRRATYGDYVFGDRNVHRRMMTDTTFFHLTPDTVRDGVTQADIDAAIDELFDRPRASYVDAPIASSSEPYPVIVMSHGDAGSRYNMESACEYLAAHGYVVIAPEHTGNSPYSQTAQDPALAADGGDARVRERMTDVLPLFNPDGTYGPADSYGQSYTPLASGLSDAEALLDLDRSLLQRVNDLRATLDELEEMNRSGPFAARLDLRRIGLMGRSYGGATTLAALALEPRFRAGLAVVPLVMRDLRPGLPAELLRPDGEESVLLSSDGPFPLGEIHKPMLILSGAEDALIIGFGASMAASLGTAPPTPEQPYPVIRDAVEATGEPVVWGVLADSNHGSFGVSGPYWWPQLKPDTQRRTFDPQQSFELVRPETAHRIQKELALDFFDWTIRRQEAAKRELIDGRFDADGLNLSYENL